MSNISNLITGAVLSNPEPELPYAEWVAGTKAIQDIVDKHGFTDIAEGAAFGFLNIYMLEGMEIKGEEFARILAEITAHPDVQKLNLSGGYSIHSEKAPVYELSVPEYVFVKGNQVTFQSPVTSSFETGEPKVITI